MNLNEGTVSFDGKNDIQLYKKQLLEMKEMAQSLTSKELSFINRKIYLLEKDYMDLSITQSNKRDQTFHFKLKSFLNKNNHKIVLIISETKYIQPILTNRPIRIVSELKKSDYDVIYAYRRCCDEVFDVPDFVSENVFQAPLDLIIKYIEDIILVRKNKKIVLFEFPIRQFVRHCDAFKKNNWVIHYDIRDNWDAMKQLGTCDWYDSAIEETLIKKANYITVVSVALKRKVGNAHLIPNGIDASYLDFKNDMKGKIIGYFGHLNQAWFDDKLLTYIAMKNPNLQFEIVGPITEKQTFPKNVVFLKEKSTNELIKIVKNWRVGIIPFKKNDITYYCDPLKLYEYLALKLNVVSVDIEQIRDYPGVNIAYSYEQFSNLLTRYDNRNEKKIKAFLKQSTMKVRVAKMIAIWEEDNGS